MRTRTNWAVLTAASLVASVAFTGCDKPEENLEEIPEVVEDAPNPETGARELKREIVLGPEDEGEQIIATGWVQGRPLDNGFFLRTEYGRIVFIQTEGADVTTGGAVRVEGTVQKSDAEAFNGWEKEALGENLEPDWDFWRGIHLHAQKVEAMPGAAPAPEGSRGGR